MRREKYRCIVCGRVFPQGQGIIIKYQDMLLSFHSSKCASKFLRILLETTPYSDLGKHIKRIHEDLVEQLKMLDKKRAKKI
ncbi:MAG: hypothetical protein DRO13_00720 [Thermoprotei archaeon]|nr:MAG: hypothetical protein DRO13_00720 [Thermoprotei archaeon]